jgi:hypothetical protein
MFPGCCTTMWNPFVSREYLLLTSVSHFTSEKGPNFTAIALVTPMLTSTAQSHLPHLPALVQQVLHLPSASTLRNSPRKPKPQGVVLITRSNPFTPALRWQMRRSSFPLGLVRSALPRSLSRLDAVLHDLILDGLHLLCSQVEGIIDVVELDSARNPSVEELVEAGALLLGSLCGDASSACDGSRGRRCGSRLSWSVGL